MRSINIKEARRTLGDLVDAAEQGESVIITRHGKDVARLDPAIPGAACTLPNLNDFRASIHVKGRPLSKVVAQARRQARY